VLHNIICTITAFLIFCFFHSCLCSFHQEGIWRRKDPIATPSCELCQAPPQQVSHGEWLGLTLFMHQSDKLITGELIRVSQVCSRQLVEP